MRMTCMQCSAERTRRRLLDRLMIHERVVESLSRDVRTAAPEDLALIEAEVALTCPG